MKCSGNQYTDCWRHLDLAIHSESTGYDARFVHLVVGIIELIPVAGKIVALLEYYIWQPPAPTSPEDRRAQPITPYNPIRTQVLKEGDPYAMAVNGAKDFDKYRNPQEDTIVSLLQKRPIDFMLECLGLNKIGSSPYFDFGQTSVADIQTKLLCGISYTDRNVSFEVSADEMTDLLAENHVYLAPPLTIEFYIGLKRAMAAKNLRQEFPSCPGGDTIKPIGQIPTLQYFARIVKDNPAQFGLDSAAATLLLDTLTLYQVSSMVVKSHKALLLCDEGYQIRSREAGTKDAFHILSISGIRGFASTQRMANGATHNLQIMTSTFERALRAVGPDNPIIIPAVGMGIWGGSPEVYWQALVDAINNLSPEQCPDIFVNPDHGPTRAPSTYSGRKGEEFAGHFYTQIRSELQNKVRIVPKKDTLFMAEAIKKAMPDKQVYVVNASDPNCTLGYLIGQYGNNLRDAHTTEEGYAMVTSLVLTGWEHVNGLLFDEGANPDEPFGDIRWVAGSIADTPRRVYGPVSV